MIIDFLILKPPLPSRSEVFTPPPSEGAGGRLLFTS